MNGSVTDLTQSAHVHVAIVTDVDPDQVESDALATVIEHELTRRVDFALLTFEFLSAQVPKDPLRRTRWAPTDHPDWADRADVVIDLRTAEHVVLDGAAKMFEALVERSAVETRRLMLDHLGITAESTPILLTATDHLALRTLSIPAATQDELRSLHAAFDHAAIPIRAHVGANPDGVEALRSEIALLKLEVATAVAARATLELAATRQLNEQARIIGDLQRRLGDATPDHPVE